MLPENSLKNKKFFAGLFLGLAILIFLPNISSANKADELRAKISTQSDEISKLEAEIKKYQTEILKTTNTANTLQNTLKQLELTNKKLSADISLTEKKISSSNLKIEELALGIKSSEKGINSNKEAIGRSVRELNNLEQTNLLEILLSAKTIGDFWVDIANLNNLSLRLKNEVEDLTEIKIDQENQKTDEETEKRKLISLKSKLADQKKIAQTNKDSTTQLLAQTKNQEATYKVLLAQQLAKKNQVAAEIRAAQEALKVIIDPNSLPSAGSKALSWPLDKVVITQYFGNTAFSKTSAAPYSGSGHNGIDLGVPVGTPIKSARGGTVIGVGDTDTACRGASYGKWILIKHDNGLSTLYTHLSLSKVSEGQNVSLGQEIGYVGMTGYTTGPHLHFSVFASAGVQVSSMQSKVAGCGVYRLPIAPYNATLNPMAYL
jgi:murein DD-endopeptidase MepM/ murein hydrolase activator NlpD